MSLTYDILEVLSRVPGKVHTPEAVSDELDVDEPIMRKTLALMAQRSLVTRTRADDGAGPGVYHLNGAQLAAFRLRQAKMVFHKPVAGRGTEEVGKQRCGSIGLTSQQVDVRLCLLRHLKDKTIFGDNPVLQMIITDYETIRRRDPLD